MVQKWQFIIFTRVSLDGKFSVQSHSSVFTMSFFSYTTSFITCESYIFLGEFDSGGKQANPYVEAVVERRKV